MPNTAATSGGTFASVDNGGGGPIWSNPSNSASSNDTYSDTNGDSNALSQWLKVTNFGFAIPAGATIDGVIVEIECKSTNGLATPEEVYLVIGGSPTGSNKGNASPVSTTEQYVTYGGAADKWGLTPTDTQINASDFGMVLAVRFTAEEDTVFVDHIRITVYYTEAGGTFTGSGTLTASSATLAGTATFAAPVYTGSGTLTCSSATLIGTATFTSPPHPPESDSEAAGGMLKLTGGMDE